MCHIGVPEFDTSEDPGEQQWWLEQPSAWTWEAWVAFWVLTLASGSATWGVNQ